VLGVLLERPMHRYEIGFTLRHRRKEDSIRRNYGPLHRGRRVAARGADRRQGDGARGPQPERTVVDREATGREALGAQVDWSLVATRAGWLLALAVFCAWFATRAFRTYQRSA